MSTQMDMQRQALQAAAQRSGSISSLVQSMEHQMELQSGVSHLQRGNPQEIIARTLQTFLEQPEDYREAYINHLKVISVKEALYPTQVPWHTTAPVPTITQFEDAHLSKVIEDTLLKE